MEKAEEKKRIALLIVKYLQEDLSQAEARELETWRSRSPRHEELFLKYTRDDFFHAMGQLYTPGEEDALWKGVRARALHASKPRHPFMWKRWAAAVACVLLVSVASYYAYRQWVKLPQDKAFVALQDIRPRSPKAKLYVNGQPKLDLRPAFSPRLKPEELFLPDILPVSTARSDWYRINVPRGGEYRLALSDSTHIFLNSESDLQIISGFSPSERKVALKGEAYFEVKHKTDSIPFTIVTAMGTVQVVGTSFNLRCYEEEACLQLTLEKGRVRFRTPVGDWVNVHPGQQLEYSLLYESLVIKEVETALYTSWREGVYVFRQTPLGKIMADLSRIYNVPITFANDELKEITFTGEIKCYDRFRTVVRVFEMTKMIRFKPTPDGLLITKD